MIVLITSVATLLTALAAIWTIIEVKRQREATYKPKLVVFSNRVYAVKKEQSIKIFDSSKVAFEPGYTFVIQNLGFGSAIDIKVRWIINYDEIVSRIQKIDSDSYFEIRNEGLVEIRSNSNQFPIAFISDKNERSAAYDHIQPVSTENMKCHFQVPDLLINLIRVYLFLLWHVLSEKLPEHKTRDIAKYNQFPLTVRIEYMDVSSRKHLMESGLQIDTTFVFVGNELGEQWHNYLMCNFVMQFR